MPTLDTNALQQIFTAARTFNTFKPDPVPDDILREIVELAKWGPTSVNSQPGRFVFLRTQQAKQRLKPALSPGNADKTMAAPVVVIVASDSFFYEQLPTQFTAFDAKAMFTASAPMAEATAARNSTLQGAYLMVAARMLGLDCGPMSGFDAAKVDAEFFADGRWKANFLFNLGHGDASGNYPRGPRLSFETVTQLL